MSETIYEKERKLFGETRASLFAETRSFIETERERIKGSEFYTRFFEGEPAR